MVNIITLTPEEYKSRCTEFEIIYGRNPSPFGECLIGITGLERAVCFLCFIDDNYEQCLEMLKKAWPESILIPNSNETAKFVDRIFSGDENAKFSVMLRGTEFQIKVWKALLQIPRGRIATYTDIQEKVESDGALAAIKANPIAYVVPCHRATGIEGENNYRWGQERRMKIMEFENGPKQYQYIC